jgi:hypothetical protein
VFWNESVSASDFETDHFRRCLADRLGWAVADAERLSATTSPARPVDLVGQPDPADDLAAAEPIAA